LAPAVLVVEDEAVIREDLASHLEDLGLTVFQAGSASGAISKILRHPEIALVFTNIRMPGPMDGRDLALWLTLNHRNIVVMVATGGHGRIDTMKHLCVACTFLKPYKPEAVGATILKALEHTVL
jgi:DNA-binding NtrC family response regulator